MHGEVIPVPSARHPLACVPSTVLGAKARMTMTNSLAFVFKGPVSLIQGSGAGLGSALLRCVTLGGH